MAAAAAEIGIELGGDDARDLVAVPPDRDAIAAHLHPSRIDEGREPADIVFEAIDARAVPRCDLGEIDLEGAEQILDDCGA